MTFVGIDLAWSARNRTGLAVTDAAGRLTASASAGSDEEIAGWLETHAPEAQVVAVDAPLVVPNATGMREAEKAIQRAFGRYDAGAYPSNRANPIFDPPRAEVLAQRFGWSVDPAERGAPGHTVCLEAFPHPAMVVLFGLDRVLAYKRGRGRTTQQRRLVFARLLDHLGRIPELRLDESPRWAEIGAGVAAAHRPMHLNAVEDEIDAILCAHLAWLWQYRPDALVVYGTLADGYIVAPPAPAPPRYLSRSRP